MSRETLRPERRPAGAQRQRSRAAARLPRGGSPAGAASAREFPFTRGIRRECTGPALAMRQYAGFGTARSRTSATAHLLEQGQTGALGGVDLPTQIGTTPTPHGPRRGGEGGVAIDSLRDMEALLDGLPIDRISDVHDDQRDGRAAAAALRAGGERQGCPPERITGTVQNDILKEYARGAPTSIRPSLDAADHGPVRLLS